jgi:hypothetical protein
MNCIRSWCAASRSLLVHRDVQGAGQTDRHRIVAAPLRLDPSAVDPDAGQLFIPAIALVKDMADLVQRLREVAQDCLPMTAETADRN